MDVEQVGHDSTLVTKGNTNLVHLVGSIIVNFIDHEDGG